MKKYFNFIFIILALLLCLSLAACADGGDSTEPGGSAQGERMAVHTVELEIDTDEIADCLSELTDKNLALGGFVENVSRDYDSDGEMRYASIVLRVPTEKKDELVAYIENNYEVSGKYEFSNDVTYHSADYKYDASLYNFMSNEANWYLPLPAGVVDPVDPENVPGGTLPEDEPTEGETDTPEEGTDVPEGDEPAEGE